MSIPVFFHPEQLTHRPLYEWAFGDKLNHPETSVRAEKIIEAVLREPGLFQVQRPSSSPREALDRIHDPVLLRLLTAGANQLAEDATMHPSVFPRGPVPHLDPDDVRHAGYYCFDSGTPIARNTLTAALWSAACAQEAARHLHTGAPMSYALSRPPGHHAAPAAFGGYCYFNNAAVAAHQLPGRVAILDIDFHHGNGTQDIFYADDRVLFVSIHGDPKEFFPFYWGHANERGVGAGTGFNLNLPLPRGVDGQAYLEVLEEQALRAIRAFQPDALVLSAGLDTFAGDPMGGFTLTQLDLHAVGVRIGRLGLPTVVVQEGGYQVDELGHNAVALLHGVHEGLVVPRVHAVRSGP